MEDTQKIIVIAEQQPVLIHHIEQIIQENASFNIQQKAYFGTQSVDTFHDSLTLQVIVLEVRLPVHEILKFANKIKAQDLHVKVFASNVQRKDVFHQEIDPLVTLKNKGIQELVNAILSVQYFEELSHYHVALPSTGATSNSRLTQREIEVLGYIGQCLSSKEIALKLHIAASTVETHRRNLIDKLGVKNSKELIRYAVKMGLDG